MVLMLVLVFVLVAGVSGVWAQAYPDNLTGLGPMQVLAILSTRCSGAVNTKSQLNTAALAGAVGLDAFDSAVRTDVAHGSADARNPVAGAANLLMQNLYVYGVYTQYIYDASWMARESIANGEEGRITAQGFPKNFPGWENRRCTYFAWFYLRQFSQIQGDPLVKVDKQSVPVCHIFHNNFHDVWAFPFFSCSGQYNIEILPNSSRWEFRSLIVSRYYAPTP
jgi:hypothetical protein